MLEWKQIAHIFKPAASPTSLRIQRARGGITPRPASPGKEMVFEARTPVGRIVTMEELTDASVNEATMIFKMCTMMHTKFAERARRCFHPPMIIKDADQIMRRNIKMLQKTGFSLLAIGFLKWRVFCANETTKTRMLSFRGTVEKFHYYFRRWVEKWRTKCKALKSKEFGGNMGAMKLAHVWAGKQREQLREAWNLLKP